MRLHHIKPIHKLKRKIRIARGGKRGGYSGRGIKGQKSRAGAKIRPAIRDLMMKLPKQRGRAKHVFKSLYEKPAVLNLENLKNKYKGGEVVSPATLLAKKIIDKRNAGREIKILGRGEVLQKLAFQNVLLSESARAKIKKAGGTIN